MKKHGLVKVILILCLTLFFASVSLSYGQSITITPSTPIPTIGVGKTIQFSAQVTGLSNAAVIWAVARINGGNATVGTITAAGLYTAPAKLPAQNPVQITATSIAKSSVSAAAYVYLLAQGPTVTSVSPDPVPVGTLTATITGSGFQKDATVFDTFGNLSVAMQTQSVTPTTIIATSYQGPAASASFSVKNPGSDYSNSISVPIGYTLRVINGRIVQKEGAGYVFTPGTIVMIAANAPPAGMVFTNWTGATVADANATTTLTMPSANVDVFANYITPRTLTVVNGAGSGAYVPGKTVTITANAPPAGQVFLNWTGATVANANAATTTLTMPTVNTTVTANYASSSKLYTLTVVNGTGSGSYPAGKIVTITANAPPAGQTFLSWTGATVANANAATTTLTMPADNKTVTANYSGTTYTYTLTVVNGTGSGAYSAGKTITITANAPPAGQVFLNWTGATVANANAATTTLTMPSTNTTVTANFTSSQPVAIPYPVTTHPRLWITVNDLPRLRSWATAGNPVYQQGIVPLLNQAVTNYKTQFFPNGVANPNFPDPGDINGYYGTYVEENAVVLALNALIDPSPTARIQYAQYARNLLMYVMNLAALGHQAGAPFRDPAFAVNNRANFYSEEWPLIVDWIYNATDASNKSILTTADKATIRKVFMLWANDCLNAATASSDHPSPIGVTNSTQLLPNSTQSYRWASNNYYIGHARQLTMMALCMDPSDDPAVNSSLPASQLGNSLRSYIPNATGAWLYQQYSMLGDPSTVASAYNIPGNGAGLGMASGGLPPEGMLYGESYAWILGQLLALQTAGFNNTKYSGPQIQLIGAPIWDRFVTGMISSLVPTPKTFQSLASMGPVYQWPCYGDMLRTWVTPNYMQHFALLALLEQQNGKTDHLNAARWFAVNAVEGGAGKLMSRISSPWVYGAISSTLYYLLLDPTAPPATDPRPTYPTVFYDKSIGRIVAHSDWSSNNTMFDYRAGWISINHQLGDGGMFEFYGSVNFVV